MDWGYYFFYNEELGYYQSLNSYQLHDYNVKIIKYINDNLRKINFNKKVSVKVAMMVIY